MWFFIILRLLLSYIHQYGSEDLSGAEALLSTYLQNVVSLCIQTLSKAQEILIQSKNGVADILKTDISDTLLYELLIGLVLLQKDKPSILSTFNWNKCFIPLLHSLDNLNRLLCDGDVQNVDDMGWPGVISGQQKPSFKPDEAVLLRKSDIDNHILDDGKWVIINGSVYDVKDYLAESHQTNELLQTSSGKDITIELSASVHRSALEHITNNLRVGKLLANDCETKVAYDHVIPLTHFKSECTLSYLLGLRATLFIKSTELQPAEIQCKKILNSQILCGGLQVLQPSNPFDEEKGEARSSGSTAGSTPTEASNNQLSDASAMSTWPSLVVSQRVESLLFGLGEARLTDPLVSTWMLISERYCKEHHLIWHQEFNADHPVIEVERLLTAVLIRHQCLGQLVLAVIDKELSGSTCNPPLPIVDIIRAVHQTKWTLIKIRQQLNRSYKEVCASMIDKCRFLLYETRPVISIEQMGLKRLHLLHKTPRFKSIVHKVIFELRVLKKKQELTKHHEYVFSNDEKTTAKNHSIENLLSELPHEIQLSNEELDKMASAENFTRSSTPSGTFLIENKHNSTENLIESDTTAIKKSEEAKTPTNDVATQLIGDHKSKIVDINSELFINDVIARLSEKCLIESHIANKISITNQIVDFVVQETVDVETLRRAMFCQIQRYQIRKEGIEMFLDLLKAKGLHDAVQYNLFNGFVGVYLDKPINCYTDNILENLNLLTAFQKSDLIITQAKIIEWAIQELQRYVNQDSNLYGKPKYHGEKDNSNLGTYVFLKKLPRARFLMNLFAILAKDFSGNELSMLINHGMLGTVMGLLKQTGCDSSSPKSDNDLSLIYEDVVNRVSLQIFCNFHLYHL